MGEYARLYTLERFGVDIGDGPPIKRPKPARIGCHCGRHFSSPQALADHKRDKHAETNSKGLT